MLTEFYMNSVNIKQCTFMNSCEFQISAPIFFGVEFYVCMLLTPGKELGVTSTFRQRLSPPAESSEVK